MSEKESLSGRALIAWEGANMRQSVTWLVAFLVSIAASVYILTLVVSDLREVPMYERLNKTYVGGKYVEFPDGESMSSRMSAVPYGCADRGGFQLHVVTMKSGQVIGVGSYPHPYTVCWRALDKKGQIVKYIEDVIALKKAGKLSTIQVYEVNGGRTPMVNLPADEFKDYTFTKY